MEHNKVLVVEDEKLIAELERDYLTAAGFDADIALDGEEGLEKALTGLYQMVLLDVMLPKRDGFEICRMLRDKLNVPIMMVTARRDDIDKIRGLGLGADDYMTKPFSPSELVARVKAHLARYERLVNSNVQENDIILLHDASESSVNAAFQIIDELEGEGYSFVTVEELILE